VLSVGGGDGRFELNTADTGSVLDGSNSDVSLLTPGGGPGVSDDVVVSDLIISSPSDSGDGVVKVGSALSRVDDTSGVVVEDLLVSLDGDGDDTLLDSTLEGVGRSGGNLSVVLDGDLPSGKGGLASARGTGLGSVWVSSLSVLTMRLQVIESLVLPSTIAAEAGLVARDEFLLREAQKLTGGSEVSVLSGGGGRESPA